MWEEFVECVETKKIVCYGAGNNAKNLLRNVSFQPFIRQIVCFVDKDKTKTGSTILVDDRPILIRDFSYLNQINDEIVIVTISDYSEIGEELTQRGIQWFPWLKMNIDLTFEPIKRRCDKKIAILLNTPNYLNLGDHAITIAEIEVLRTYYSDVFELDTGMCNDIGLKQLKEYISDDDIIYIQGGGNMGALWRTCENNIRRIVEAFPKNEIFIFPQSIFYDKTPENQQYLRESIPIYNGHKNLKICLREKKSLEFVKNTYSCKCALVPDMVLTMNYHDTGKIRNGVGVLLRNDKERVLDKDYIECINDTAEGLGKSIKQISHHKDEGVIDRKVRFDKMLETYAGCEIVITDRLHGMIFSAITNTPCIVFDNCYGKISSLYDTWLKDESEITITGKLNRNDLKNMILQKLNSSSCEIRSNEFKNIILTELKR